MSAVTPMRNGARCKQITWRSLHARDMVHVLAALCLGALCVIVAPESAADDAIADSALTARVVDLVQRYQADTRDVAFTVAIVDAWYSQRGRAQYRKLFSDGIDPASDENFGDDIRNLYDAFSQTGRVNVVNTWTARNGALLITTVFEDSNTHRCRSVHLSFEDERLVVDEPYDWHDCQLVIEEPLHLSRAAKDCPGMALATATDAFRVFREGRADNVWAAYVSAGVQPWDLGSLASSLDVQRVDADCAHDRATVFLRGHIAHVRPDDMQIAVEMVSRDGVWQVDRFQLGPTCTSWLCGLWRTLVY